MEEETFELAECQAGDRYQELRKIPMEVDPVQQPPIVKDPMDQLNMPPVSLNQVENEMDVDKEEGVEEEEMIAKEQQKEENLNPIDTPITCRSVRIGSFKVHPQNNNKTLPVFLSMDGISFSAPTVFDEKKIINITLKPSDVTQMLVHFGPCLLLVFITTTTNFAEDLRRSLKMSVEFLGYYDPTSADEKQKRIVFLIESLQKEHSDFFKRLLNGDNYRELDQETANTILVRSTILQFNPRLLTYPPAPQTGGYTLNMSDVIKLKEGKWLNDVIIEFYLTFIYNEKFTKYHQEKTHIFSSYFLGALVKAYTEVKPKAGETHESVKERWYDKVKGWAKKVNLFSKDFIIIPINQSNHWFLAIICYPGFVPEALKETNDDEDSKKNKSYQDGPGEDQEENKLGNNQNSDENSTESKDKPDEEAMPEVPDNSKDPDKIRHKKEVPCICIFDSLNRPNHDELITMLREYLEMEWKKKSENICRKDFSLLEGYIMQCPQQRNTYDCGLYLLQYVESFFESPIPYFNSPDLTDWFPNDKISSKREELLYLISHLKKSSS